MSDILFKDDDLLVRLCAPHRSRQLIVSFSPLKRQPMRDRPGFGADFCAKYGLDAIFVTCRGNDWYQYPGMPAALNAIRERVSGHPEIVTYGSSMGAYQALKWAGPLGATRCVAISPQYSVDPRKVKDEPRWQDDAARITFIDDEMIYTPGIDYILIYDPYDPLERAQINHIKARLETDDLRLPFSSHPSGDFLRQAGIVSQVMLPLLRGEARPRQLRGIVRANRRNSVLYMSAAALSRKVPAAWRRSWLRTAVALEPERADLLTFLAAFELDAGNFEAAHAAAGRAVVLDPTNPQIRYVLAKALFKRKIYTAAEVHVQKALRRQPDHANALKLYRKLTARRP